MGLFGRVGVLVVAALFVAAVPVGPGSARRTADTTPPTVDAHGDQTVASTGAGPTSFTLTVTASDPDDASAALQIFCSWSSQGVTFTSGSATVSLNVGTWSMTCYAKDPAGNQSANISFNVDVQPFVDHTAPVLQVANQTIPASSKSGTTLFYTVTATDPDNDPGQLTITCDHNLAGGVFPIGVTQVSCTAKDPANNVGSGSFTVTVTDGTTTGTTTTVTTTTTSTTTTSSTTTTTTRVTTTVTTGSTQTTTTTRPSTVPTIQQLSNIVVDATSPIGAVVRFAPQMDDPSGQATLDCKPASGSLFGLRAKSSTNRVTVICNAIAAGGAPAKPMAFTITVLGARDQLQALRRTVLRAKKRTLAAQLARADAAIATGRKTAALADLASFIKGARSAEPGAAWIKDAARIIALLG